MAADTVTVAFLNAFAEAWNRHDTNAVLDAMTADAVMTLSAGPAVDGTRYEGRDELRKGVEGVFALFPDVQWQNPTHFVAGDRGVTEWLFAGTRKDGTRVEARGCDIFTFRDGRIAVKNSFRKQRQG